VGFGEQAGHVQAEADALRERIVAALSDEVGGELRA